MANIVREHVILGMDKFQIDGTWLGSIRLV